MMMMMMMMVLGVNRIPELDQKKEFTHFNFLDKIKPHFSHRFIDTILIMMLV